jgi:hypothetical protein
MRHRVLPGADVAAIDTARTKRFQMTDQRAVARARLAKAADAATARIRPDWQIVSVRQ